MKPFSDHRFSWVFPVLSVLLICTINPSRASEISDVPLDLQVISAPANLVLILDTSISMDSELLTSDHNGLFEGLSYLFPSAAYTPAADHVGVGDSISEEQRRNWQTQWCKYNRLYYNPHRDYSPWPSTQRYEFQDADLKQPLSNATKASASAARVDLATPFLSVNLAEESLLIPQAHYFTLLDTNGNDRYDDGEAIYLILWSDTDFDSQMKGAAGASDKRRYFRLHDDGDQQVEDYELIAVTSEEEKNRIRPVLYDEKGEFIRFKSDYEDLQNFANWFCYHRRRISVLKAAVANLILSLQNVQVGIYASNGDLSLAVQPIKVVDVHENGSSVDHSQSVLDTLYELKPAGQNKLRTALDQVGRYFHQHRPSIIGESPFWTENGGGACQHTCALVITGSYAEGDFAGLGNVDGTLGPPYGDRWENTLADVAMHYHEADIAPDLPDLVPEVGCERGNVHQQMITYTLSFGVSGTLPLNLATPHNDSDKLDPCSNVRIDIPNWPFPVSGSPTSIDDLWHAAINGSGVYVHVNEPTELHRALKQLIVHWNRRIKGASNAWGYSTLISGAAIYQSLYRSEDWSGDVVAYRSDPFSEIQKTTDDSVLWRADERLQAIDNVWDRRRIITFGGLWQTPRGVPFRYEFLSDRQRKGLGSDLVSGSSSDQKARQLLEYIRGRAQPAFRARTHILGDIVHSVPVLAEEIVFVGSNDGMLHAFDAVGGTERFAYVPNLIMDQLHHLSEMNYASEHRCYVDGPIYTGEIMTDHFHRQMLLVGGLGKGGKGYYCLQIGKRRRMQNGDQYGSYENQFTVRELTDGHSENDFADMVLWEYPCPAIPQGEIDEEKKTDPDMGFSFSSAYAVNANAPQNRFRPVVIFGNGYDSDNGHAVLYILDALQGKVIRKIDTGVGGNNGLSTPALIDSNMDRLMDYAFAGDLKGNLWKFDLTSSDPNQWGVAYGTDVNRDGVIDANQGDHPMPLISTCGQPITGRPDVMRMRSICAAQAPGFMVIFGTGRYLTESDRYDAGGQSIYGVWDYGDDSDDSEHLGELIDHANGRLSNGLVLLRRTIAGETIRNGQLTRLLSDQEIEYGLLEDTADSDACTANNRLTKKEPNPDKYAGWYIDFPIPPDPFAHRGERVTATAIIRGGKVILNSFAPLQEPCTPGSFSWIYFLDGCSGNPVKDQKGELMLPWRHDGRIKEALVYKTINNLPLELMFLTDQRGEIIRKEILGEKWGRIYWRQN